MIRTLNVLKITELLIGIKLLHVGKCRETKVELKPTAKDEGKKGVRDTKGGKTRAFRRVHALVLALRSTTGTASQLRAELWMHFVGLKIEC